MIFVISDFSFFVTLKDRRNEKKKIKHSVIIPQGQHCVLFAQQSQALFGGVPA